jgi:hypothetical protein
MKQQVYKKVNRRYIPVGYSDGWSGFPTDGIWLVQTTPGIKSSECILKIGDNEEVIKFASNILKYKDKLVDYLAHNKNIITTGKSINETAIEIIKVLSDG